MDRLSQFDRTVWDRFFDFVTPDVTDMSIEQIRIELRRASIDTSAAYKSVMDTLAGGRAREELAAARKQREQFLSICTGFLMRPVEDARALISELAAKTGLTGSRAVLFRKLEQAATSEDLQRLLDDMARLDRLESESIDDQS